MKPSMIDRIGKSVAYELDKLPASEDYLPMPQFHSKKISCYEWQHWIQRLERQRQKDPNYENGFDRVAKVTVQKGWSLLGAPKVLEQKSRPPTYKFMDESAVAERIANARIGLLTGIALFVRFGLKNRRVTFTDLVDVLAGAFSPYYLARSPIVSSIRELSLESVSNCRRDLHHRGVLADRIWDAISTWAKNPLFRLDKDELGHDTVISPRLLQRSTCLGEFQALIARDPMFERWPGRSLRLNIINGSRKRVAAGEHKPFARSQRQKICAERPYNVVLVDEAATALLRIQEGVTLYFDVDEFKKDYVAAEQIANHIKRELLKNYGVRAYLSIRPRKFSKEGKKLTSIRRVSEVLYRSYAVALLTSEHDTGMSTRGSSDDYIRETYANIHNLDRLENDKERKRYVEKREKYARRLEGFKEWLNKAAKRKGAQWSNLAAEAQQVVVRVPVSPEDLWLLDQESRQWRIEVRKVLNKYDAARRHLSTFAEAREQVKSRTDLVPIQTQFAFSLNRRFQPHYLWPTHVTSRQPWTSSTEGLEKSEIGVWTDEEKAASLRKRWFKWRDPETKNPQALAGCDISSSQMQILATFLAEESLEEDAMHRNVAFKEYMAERALECSPPVLHDGYDGPTDRKLQNLVKELLMRVSYGSKPMWVAIEQWGQPLEFGPGWTKDGAKTFIKMFDEMYPKVDLFREACDHIGNLAFQQDSYAGVFLRDPATGVEVRWNPVKQKKVHVDFANKKAYFSAPVSDPNGDGDYAVDKNALRHMIMPCLVQMLDAFYSGLVMSELHRHGCRTFVGIHDCWLVPKSKLSVLERAMRAASEKWYAGLEPVYEDLLKYLEHNGKYAALIESARRQWSQRVAEGYRPAFKAKWDET